jgi:ATP-dependent helicase/DNAse subunit B
VPLKLVTGPANAAKAGEVLGGLRARLDEDPILVVPTLGDVEHAQRELAERGAVFGARVLRFKWLFEEIAARVGYLEPVASDFQRELIVEEAVRRTKLRVLAQSASQPGFTRAAARFVTELGRARVDAPRLTIALRQWAGRGPRHPYADDVASVYTAYRDGLEAAGLVDEELFGWRALDALRRGPMAWGDTPLFVYGFDDFDRLQLDALESVAAHADVTVSLPYEPGRRAFKTIATLHQELLGLGAEELELAPVDDHYAPESRDVLHHIERKLFEDDPAAQVDPGAAVSFHSAGGERAEV